MKKGENILKERRLLLFCNIEPPLETKYKSKQSQINKKLQIQDQYLNSVDYYCFSNKDKNIVYLSQKPISGTLLNAHPILNKDINNKMLEDNKTYSFDFDFVFDETNLIEQQIQRKFINNIVPKMLEPNSQMNFLMFGPKKSKKYQILENLILLPLVERCQKYMLNLEKNNQNKYKLKFASFLGYQNQVFDLLKQSNYYINDHNLIENQQISDQEDIELFIQKSKSSLKLIQMKLQVKGLKDNSIQCYQILISKQLNEEENIISALNFIIYPNAFQVEQAQNEYFDIILNNENFDSSFLNIDSRLMLKNCLKYFNNITTIVFASVGSSQSQLKESLSCLKQISKLREKLIRKKQQKVNKRNQQTSFQQNSFINKTNKNNCSQKQIPFKNSKIVMQLQNKNDNCLQNQSQQDNQQQIKNQLAKIVSPISSITQEQITFDKKVKQQQSQVNSCIQEISNSLNQSINNSLQSSNQKKNIVSKIQDVQFDGLERAERYVFTDELYFKQKNDLILEYKSLFKLTKQYKSLINEMGIEVQRLNRLIPNQQNIINELKEKIFQESEISQQLQQDVNNQNRINIENQGTMDNLKEKVPYLEKEINLLRIENEDKNKNLIFEKRKNQQLADELSEYKKKVKKTQYELEKEQKNVVAFENECHKLQIQNQNINKIQIEEQQQQLEQFQYKIQEFERINVSNEKLLNDKNQIIEELQKDLEIKSNQVDIIQTQLVTTQLNKAERAQLERWKDEIMYKKTELEEQLESLCQQLTLKNEEIQSLRQNKQDIQQELLKEKQQKLEIETNFVETEEKHKMIQTLNNELEDSKKLVSFFNKEKEILMKQVEEQQIQNQELQKLLKLQQRKDLKQSEAQKHILTLQNQLEICAHDFEQNQEKFIIVI